MRLAFRAVLVAVAGFYVFYSMLFPLGCTAAANWHLNRFQLAYEDGDFEQSLVEIDDSLWWSKAANAIYLRSHIYEQLGRNQDAYDDLTTLLDNKPKFEDYTRAKFLMQRAYVARRLDNVKQAELDIDEAYRLRPARNAQFANGRAYLLALMNVRLDQAKQDIDDAFAWQRDGASDGQNAAYLDTRSWIYFRQQNYEKALSDADTAIKLCEAEFEQLEQAKPRTPNEERRYQFMHRGASQTLAVMYHHRGEIQQALKHGAEAKADLQRAEKLGYNPNLD